MRLVVPYTRLHPITDAALRELVPDAERVNVGSDDLAYWRLMVELWFGDGFTICEHDIEPTAEAIEAARECNCLWGRSSYPYSITRTAGLGFTCFSAELIAREPNLMHELKQSAYAAVAPQHWATLDWTIYTELCARGYQPHEHPPVSHHHWMPGGVATPQCSCGSKTQRLCPGRRHHADDPSCRCKTAQGVRPLVDARRAAPSKGPDVALEAQRRSRDVSRRLQLLGHP